MISLTVLIPVMTNPSTLASSKHPQHYKNVEASLLLLEISLDSCEVCVLKIICSVSRKSGGQGL